MASITLAQSAPLSQDFLVRGVIQTIYEIDRFFEVLPMTRVIGNAHAFNRELVAGDAQGLAVGGTITANAAGTVETVSASLKTLIADAQINKLIAGSRSNINDQVAYQVMNKAKTIGQLYQKWVITGVDSTSQFAGLLSLTATSQKLTPVTNGEVLSFARLDELADRVTDKNGVVDYLMMSRREVRAFKALMRTAGGATATEVVTLPSGKDIISYNGVPIFANDNIPTNQVQGTSSIASTIIAGTLDDGSNSVGISGLILDNEESGIYVEEVGTHFERDEAIWRVKFYAGLANFNQRGLATWSGVIPT